MKTLLSYIFLFTLLFYPCIPTFGVPAIPYPVKITQSDGSTLNIKINGDESFNYRTTLDGYLIVPDIDNIYTYADITKEGDIVSTHIRVNEIAYRNETEKKLLARLTPNPDMANFEIHKRNLQLKDDNPPRPKGHPTSGSPKCLVILVNYEDVKFSVPSPQQAFSRLLNEEGYAENGATGSVRDYFKDSSTGKFNPEFVVIGPYDLPQKRAYYGVRNTFTGMENSRDMVKHACEVAHQAGFNFSEFDTNDDEYVDNISIIFAGHNEAEGGLSESIWPHCYVMEDPFTKFDDKRIYNFMCVSELKGPIGTNMCGVGTFIHEFGHVLGLKDYYVTRGTKHHTLSFWSVMDQGPYLNEGRTPPAYSAYDRFCLDWIKPTELLEPQRVTLEALTKSNAALLITENGDHNMNGINPKPVEFFTLENRQQTGWDKYLPGTGLLITRIYYNSSTWNSNTVNNEAQEMGIDIIEADEIASAETLSGDTYPGTSQIYSYLPVSRSGNDWKKPLSFIRENDGIVTFRFMGANAPEIIAKGTFSEYRTEQGTPSDYQMVTVSGIRLESDISVSFEKNQHFEIKKAGDENSEWVKTLTLNPIDKEIDEEFLWIRYNPAEPSFDNKHTDKVIFEAEDAEPMTMPLSGISTRRVWVVPPVANPATDITAKGFVANWEPVYDATGYYLTVFSISEGNSLYEENFDNGLTAPEGWIINSSEISSNPNHYGKNAPAVRLNRSEDYIETEEFIWSASKISIHVKSIGGNGELLIEGWNETEWIETKKININVNIEGNKEFQLDENDNYRKFRISFVRKSGSVALDDINVELSREIAYIVQDDWIDVNSNKLENLENEQDYIYKVKASDKTLNEDGTIKYENITLFSNWILVHTQDGGSITNEKMQDGLQGMLNSNPNSTINIYNVMGQQVKSILPSSDRLKEILSLPKGRVYILQTGNSSMKLIL